MKVKTIVVNDKMQKGYCYTLAAPTGRDFDREFAPAMDAQSRTRLRDGWRKAVSRAVAWA